MRVMRMKTERERMRDINRFGLLLTMNTLMASARKRMPRMVLVVIPIGPVLEGWMFSVSLVSVSSAIPAQEVFHFFFFRSARHGGFLFTMLFWKGV